MLQRKYTAPRDYYDLWYILCFENTEVDWTLISKMALKKCIFKNIILENSEAFFVDKNLRILRSHWKSSLGHHINNDHLPEVERVIAELKLIITSNLIL